MLPTCLQFCKCVLYQPYIELIKFKVATCYNTNSTFLLFQTTRLDPSARPQSPADAQAAQRSETTLSDVLSARSLDVTGPFETVGRAAQLLGVAHPHRTGLRQQAEAAEPHLTVFHQITAEAVLTTPGTASLLQQAAAEQSSGRRVDRHYVTGRTLALGQVQAAIMMLLLSSQLHQGVCL